MTTLPVIFTRSHTLGSLVLRGFLWSPWSHCALVVGEHVIEAHARYGVQMRPLQDLINASSKWEIRHFPCRDPDAVIERAASQIGKPYDWRGVLGIATRQGWQHQLEWFCSELVAWAFATAGSPLFRAHPYRITPRDLSILPH